jgi:hypothetical protein
MKYFDADTLTKAGAVRRIFHSRVPGLLPTIKKERK